MNLKPAIHATRFTSSAVTVNDLLWRFPQMKNYLLLFSILFTVLGQGCSTGKEIDSGSKRILFVSILPQKYFLDRIGGEFAETRVLVRPGESPASYEPRPSQMTELSRSGVLFSIGVPFETRLLTKLESQDKNLKIYDSAAGISHELMEQGSHDHDHGDSGDPHIWLDPLRAKEISANMLTALVELFPENENKLRENFNSLAASLDSINAEIGAVLLPCRGRTIFIYHPSLGYFCKRYGLEQVAVEISGKEPSAKELAAIGELITGQVAGCMFIQPQFNSSIVNFVSRTYGVKTVTVDPLAENYIDNLSLISAQIADCLHCGQ